MNGSVWLVQLSNVGVTDVGGKAEKGSASGGEPRGCRLGPRHLLDPSPSFSFSPRSPYKTWRRSPRPSLCPDPSDPSN